MSCPDPYRPYNPFEDATPDAEPSFRTRFRLTRKFAD